MRLALVLTPKPSSPAEGTALREGAAWLRASLAPLGFRVLDASDAAAVDAMLAEARAGSDPDDALLVHVSGRFADGGFLWDGARHVALRDLSAAVARRGLDRVLFVLELTHDGRADDALRAAESVEAIDAALDLRARGFAAVIAVRPTASAVSSLAFTRLVVDCVDAARQADPNRTLVLSEVYEHVRAAAQGHPAAQSFALVRGAFDFEVSVPVVVTAPGAARPPSERAAVADESLLEPLLALADGGRARKEWDHALAGYRAALLVSQLVAAGDAAAQSRIYGRIGALERERGRPHDAIRAFEAAIAAAPRDRAAFDALVSLSVGAGDVAREVEFRHRRAALIDEPEPKVDELFAVARLLVEKLHDLPGAIDILEEAQSIDPSREDVLEALRRALTVLARRSGDDGVGDEAETEARQVSGEIDTRRASANDPIQARPDLEALERTILLAPLEPSTYEKLFWLHVQSDRPDRALLAAMALEELGAAAPDAKALLADRRADGPIKPRASFDDSAWQAIRARGADDVVEGLFSAVARVAVAAHMDQRRERRKLVTLDPARRQSATSTASAVRSFHWAAHVLGVVCPTLFVLDDVQGGIAAVPADEPSTVLGPSVVRGLTTKDLAFLGGRHLAYYRAEHNVLVYFPTLKQLTILLLATVQLSLSGLPVPDGIAAQVGALRERIDRKLQPGERATIADAVSRLDARGGRADLAAWIRSVELTAARAGLVLCGDLRTAMTRARADARGIAGVTIDDTRADLVAFCASSAHGDLRERLAFGADAPPSSMSGMLTRDGRVTSAIANG